ncbi:MAG TPA: GNAT family N-acetyltransferase, partial [Spirochaetia bacterium]|nr:GNAT family N-acetyltransferase [Spirochaetia bacterium]
RRRGYANRGADFSRFEEEVDRVHDLLNRSLAHLPGFIGWERSAVRALLAPFRRFADPDLILFAEKDGKTVGFFPAIPDLNEIFRTCDGFSDLSSTLAGLWRLAFRSRPLRPADRFPSTILGRRYRCVTIKSVLVPPEHWNAGVAALLFDEMLRRLEGRGYEWIDLSLTSADNPNTPVLAERFGGRVYKRYRVFRRPIGPAGAVS